MKAPLRITTENHPQSIADGIVPKSIRVPRAIREARRLAQLNPNVMLWKQSPEGNWFRISLRRRTLRRKVEAA